MEDTTPVPLEFEGGVFVEKKTIKWKINNFDIIMKSEDYLRAQKIDFDFTDRNGIKSCWRARMRFRSPRKTDGDRTFVVFGIVLLKKDDSVSELNAQFWVRLEDVTGREFFHGQPKHELRHATKRWVNWHIEFLTPETIIDLIDGVLVITIGMKTFSLMTIKSDNIVKTSAKGEDTDVCVNRRSQQFYQTISTFENNEAHSDAKIVSSDGQEFFAYRWILSGVSDVFEAMFRSNMMEGETGVVKLEDLSGSTVKILLHFIYTGKLDKKWSSPEIVEELTYAADKFQLDDLKEYLDQILDYACTVENAANLLDFADKANMKNAAENIVAFIKARCMNPEEFLVVLRNMKI